MLHNYENGAKVKTYQKHIETLNQFIVIWEGTEDEQLPVLSEMYQAWCEKNRLPQYSADELISELKYRIEKITQ